MDAAARKVVTRTNVTMLGTEGSLDVCFLGLSAIFDATEPSSFWDTSQKLEGLVASNELHQLHQT